MVVKHLSSLDWTGHANSNTTAVIIRQLPIQVILVAKPNMFSLAPTQQSRYHIINTPGPLNIQLGDSRSIPGQACQSVKIWRLESRCLPVMVALLYDRRQHSGPTVISERLNLHWTKRIICLWLNQFSSSMVAFQSPIYLCNLLNCIWF